MDFGIMEAVETGELCDIRLLILSSPASNTAFYEPLPSENQECLFEGIKKPFGKADDVPRSIWIDNMTTAVKAPRSKTEEATLTDEFLRFQLHYGLQTQVCNVAKGNEKGHVEGKVSYVRYNLFSVPPVSSCLKGLTQTLDEFSIVDQERLHYEKEIEIKTLWKQETATLLFLPENEYMVRKERMVKPNPYNEVKIDQGERPMNCFMNNNNADND
ncbi:putative transposase [Fictibacillus macauensis ZFHKF-1]|uniref:Putative transposase n=1 Tax=Fictibacillus macauensis ZFHKF-1 TaxID=1196324 RepID=I8AG59_9BACL|nr:transposase [Fictibacillus macauensis]EIT84384.1 putative transposase [Fictibacillus macauensis ZFHKF-1]